jgi:hypothetical protein
MKGAVSVSVHIITCFPEIRFDTIPAPQYYKWPRPWADFICPSKLHVQLIVVVPRSATSPIPL